ncbi:helix-turn-helix transcriptional regulator [uncultured Tateyamaria sp.]|uniref:helix-turn-helix domain-containing protein n=1 Tax=uncultured Tateyamaria sp. TaxID=455651 RepID=UPI00262ADDD9|nr:helix-turn-helix transcriptional regulator [uncultured Tateyamaria sp.]
MIEKASICPKAIESDRMKINSLTPDTIILEELGTRLAKHRKQRGFSQDDLAREAGLGVATLRRIEAGEGSQMESWLKLLKALKMLSGVEQLLPESIESPLAQVRAQSKTTKRTTSSGKRWGDETE